MMEKIQLSKKVYLQLVKRMMIAHRGKLKQKKLITIKKKIINYKNAWLEIYDKPIIYFPKFFHPDPTVKRQSGFLMPQIMNSSSLGLSLKLPYYKVISDNKDLTFTPRIFSENEALFQNEYRQVNKNSKHIADFSLKEKTQHLKHIFFQIL